MAAAAPARRGSFARGGGRPAGRAAPSAGVDAMCLEAEDHTRPQRQPPAAAGSACGVWRPERRRPPAGRAADPSSCPLGRHSLLRPCLRLTICDSRRPTPARLGAPSMAALARPGAAPSWCSSAATRRARRLRRGGQPPKRTGLEERELILGAGGAGWPRECGRRTGTRPSAAAAQSPGFSAGLAQRRWAALLEAAGCLVERVVPAGKESVSTVTSVVFAVNSHTDWNQLSSTPCQARRIAPEARTLRGSASA